MRSKPVNHLLAFAQDEGPAIMESRCLDWLDMLAEMGEIGFQTAPLAAAVNEARAEACKLFLSADSR